MHPLSTRMLTPATGLSRACLFGRTLSEAEDDVADEDQVRGGDAAGVVDVEAPVIVHADVAADDQDRIAYLDQVARRACPVAIHVALLVRRVGRGTAFGLDAVAILRDDREVRAAPGAVHLILCARIFLPLHKCLAA